MRSVISILFSGLFSDSKTPVHQMQEEAPRGSTLFERSLEDAREIFRRFLSHSDTLTSGGSGGSGPAIVFRAREFVKRKRSSRSLSAITATFASTRCRLSRSARISYDRSLLCRVHVEECLKNSLQVLEDPCAYVLTRLSIALMNRQCRYVRAVLYGLAHLRVTDFFPPLPACLSFLGTLQRVLFAAGLQCLSIS